VKYHNNSAIVQELIAGKLVSGQWKEHPEFPGNQDSWNQTMFNLLLINPQG
jgi:hypothetical protein